MKIRAVFDNFAPYEWETSPREIAEKANIPITRVLRLDTNTSPFVPHKWLSILSKDLINLPVNQYPDTKYTELTQMVAKYCKVKLNNIVITNGADEAIDIIVKTLLDCGDKVILSTPSYSMFRIASEIAGAKVINVDRKNDPLFADDIDEMVRVGKREKASAIFLCNPNNPTGTFLEIRKINKLAEELNCGIIVDEAYYEYCGKSAVDLIKQNPNIIIVRTFSKAFSLAGERIGCILANKWTVDKFNYVRPPNSLSVTSLELGTIALSDIEQVKDWVKQIINERERCFTVLRSLSGVTPYPSLANFILFRLLDIDANYVHQELLRKGIIVRNVSGVRKLENCLRVTIGTRKENNRFLSEFKRILERR